MAGYIKSHSNYRLQTRHQLVNNGAIFERDISTIGGVNSFATGQSTIYQSGNFVVVVNNGGSVAKHVKKGGWLASGANRDIWDSEILKEYSSDITGSIERNITLKNDFMDLRSFSYYGSLSNLIETTVKNILTDFPYEIYFGKEQEIENGIFLTSNPGKIDINTKENSNDNSTGLGHFYNGGIENYGAFVDGIANPANGFDFSWDVIPGYPNKCEADKHPENPFAAIVTIEITIPENDRIVIQVGAFYNDDGSIRYAHTYQSEKQNPVHIRPRPGKFYYEDFIDNLDLFGKCLMGVYSGVKNTSKFEILNETNKGTTKTVKSFTFPTTYGKYNLANDGVRMGSYIQELGRIGNRYDEVYTDNLYRMMTHDSLKNLDWTKGFNGDNGDDNQYVKTGEKFASVIRIMGYVFDQEKAYIDSIGYVNTITYSNRSNLSDYFLTDSLETDGWVVTSIYPYELKFYDSNNDPVGGGVNWDASEQTKNYYTRKFNENTTEIIEPYSYSANTYYTKCVDKYPELIPIPDYSGQTYVVDGDKVYNVLTDYTSNTEYSIADVNNEFMKRLRINSKNIFRKKGTIDGIESILSLFGMRSKRWYESHNLSFKGAYRYDFDIQEYTEYAPYVTDEWDTVHKMYKMDWYNSCKTISYPTQSYINGEYIPYQGLPVAYRKKDNEVVRRIYPFFSNSGYYDGGMYYQMNGGWLDYSPYRFDVNENMYVYSSSYQTNVETMSNVMLVNNISELMSQPSGELYDGVVYYVTDISERFALINGIPYQIKEDYINGEIVKYFEVSVYGSAVSVGGALYTGKLTVSDPSGYNNTQTYILDLYEDGTIIRVYYTGDRNNAFILYGSGNVDYYSVSPETSLLFENGCYTESVSGQTHYFILTDIDGQGKLGDNYWRQILEREPLYQRVNTVVDNYEGNNPHTGNFKYDNGEEYIRRYKKLFKYASENKLFNETCFTNIESDYENINSYGFANVYNIIDDKVHAFVDKYDSGNTITRYDIDNKSSLISSGYNAIEQMEGGDGEPSQIINTKKIKITFYLKTNNMYSKEGQEEVKYIQCKIMPYVEQMIPSTAIVNILFDDGNHTPVLHGSFDASYDDSFD